MHLKQVRAKLQEVTEEKDKVATMLEEHTVLVKELQGTNIHVLSTYVSFVVVLHKNQMYYRNMYMCAHIYMYIRKCMWVVTVNVTGSEYV